MLAPSAAVFSLLLIVTGIAKVARPADVERALSQLGLPRVRGAGVFLGVIEVGVGVTALLVPQMLIAQAILYAAFAVWVVVALRSDTALASCGCLGREDTPPTIAHLALNLTASLVSSLALLGPSLDLGSGFGGVATVVVVLVGVYLAYVILTDAASLVGVRRP